MADNDSFDVLPDYLAPRLKVIFCGTAAGPTSARRGHYYAGAGNRFWRWLWEAGFTPVRLGPEQDSQVLDFGIGLTDLAKQVASGSDAGLREQYDVAGLLTKVEAIAPAWLAFHGRPALDAVSRFLGHGAGGDLGVQSWCVGLTRVYRLPSPSGANANPRNWVGRESALAWWRELAELAR